MQFVGEEVNLVALSSFALEFYLFKQKGEPVFLADFVLASSLLILLSMFINPKRML